MTLQNRVVVFILLKILNVLVKVVIINACDIYLIRCSVLRYVLIACDGLWKAFDNRTAIEFINKVLNVSAQWL